MRLRHFIIISLVALLAPTAQAQVTYANTSAKADRFFDNKEWASAAAVYGLMLHERPDVPDTYGRAIVANEMLGDTIKAMQLLDKAMNYSVPLDSVLTQVRRYSFAIGQGNMYEHFMVDAARQHPWMQRPLDAYLLRYYAFRRNGAKMIEISRRMLDAAPGNIEFMAIEAEGYMICGQPAQAVAIWQQIVESDNDNYDAILNLANYYDIVGDPTAALFYFERAIALRATPYVQAKINEIKK